MHYLLVALSDLIVAPSNLVVAIANQTHIYRAWCLTYNERHLGEPLLAQFSCVLFIPSIYISLQFLSLLFFAKFVFVPTSIVTDISLSVVETETLQNLTSFSSSSPHLGAKRNENSYEEVSPTPAIASHHTVNPHQRNTAHNMARKHHRLHPWQHSCMSCLPILPRFHDP